MARIDNKEGIILPNYIGGNWYMGDMPGQQFTSTNTTPLVDDVIYAVPNVINRPVTISEIGFRTSGTNASVGANLKIGVYAADGADGAPGTLLAIGTAPVSVGDSALSTAYTVALDKPVFIAGPLFWIAVLQDSTTGVRTAIPTLSYVRSSFFGNATAGGVYAGSAIPWGYTGVGTYAGGMPSAFGTPTLQTNSGLTPVCVYKVV